MKLFVAGAANRLPEFGHYLCDFVSPARRQYVGGTPIWAADNGCFGDFSRDQFLRMLDAIARAPTRPVFVTVPDVVANHRATVERWLEWAGEFTARQIPRALVLQNGIETLGHPEHAIPWALVDALFIGGDDAFKLGPWVRVAMATARLSKLGPRPIWCHMGRVNTIRRMRYARAIGCDSTDGSAVARFPGLLKRLCRALDADDQPRLL